MDLEPAACVCDNGWHQLRVNGGPWSEPVDRDGRHWHELPG